MRVAKELSWEGARGLPWEARPAALLPLGAASLAALLDEPCFQRAWQRVRRHPGPGLDGVSAALFARHLQRNLAHLRRDVLRRRYRPGGLLRIQVPKKGGGQRPLGIPTIADRVVQVAVHLAVIPLLDGHLARHVHGYRPRRSPRTAVAHLLATCRTRPWLEVVKADVEGLFDNLSHPRVLGAAEQAWRDPLWCWLQRQWLRRWANPATPGRGVPQGAPLSPLLANLYLHRPVDLPIRRALKGRGLDTNLGLVAAVRYGDDFLLVSQRRHGAIHLLRWLQGLLTPIALKLTPAKTSMSCGAARRPLPVPFLGGYARKSCPFLKALFRTRDSVMVRGLEEGERLIMTNLPPVLVEDTRTLYNPPYVILCRNRARMLLVNVRAVKL